MLRWIILVLSIAWIIVMWYVVIYALKRGWGPYIRSKRQPKTRVNCRIKAKQGRHDINSMGWQLELVEKVLVFECDDGIERDYGVNDDVFDWVEEGDDGVLVYQGDLFVAFEAHRPRHDMDKIYKTLTRS